MAGDPSVTASRNAFMREYAPELSIASPREVLDVDGYRVSTGQLPSRLTTSMMALAAAPEIRGNIPNLGGDRPSAGTLSSSRVRTGEAAERTMLEYRRRGAQPDVSPGGVLGGIGDFAQRGFGAQVLATGAVGGPVGIGTAVGIRSLMSIARGALEGRDVGESLRSTPRDIISDSAGILQDIDRPRGALIGGIDAGPSGVTGGFARPDLYLGRDLPGIRDINDENVAGPLSWRDIVGGAADVALDPADLLIGGGIAGDIGRLGRAGVRSFDNAALRAAEGPLETSTRGVLRAGDTPGSVQTLTQRPPNRPIAGGATDTAASLTPSSVFEAPPTVRRLYGARPIEEGDVRGISRFAEEGRVRADDPMVTPGLRVRDESRRAVTNQATRIEASARSIVRRSGFRIDDNGRIPALAGIDPRVPGAPTLRDVAARLPIYEPHLNARQIDSMLELRDALTPYRQAIDEVAQIEARLTGKPSTIQIGSRPDVMEGGFYIPRGTAETEELADIALRRRGGGGGRRTKQGFERSATFGSEAEGIEAGYQYTPISEAMGGYVRGAGNRTLDRHTANYFLSRTDARGQRLAQNAADRLDPQLRAEVQSLRTRISGRLQTLRNRSVRASVEGAEAQRTSRIAEQRWDRALSAETRAILRKARIEEVEVWMPDVVRETVPEVNALRLRLDRLRARPQTPATARQIGETEALIDIRRAADSTDDYGEMLGSIEESLTRLADAQMPNVRARGRQAAPFGSPERAAEDAGRAQARSSGINVTRPQRGRDRTARSRDLPFDGDEASIEAYEDVLNRALQEPILDISRTPSTDSVIAAADREMRVLQREARRTERAAEQAGERSTRTTDALTATREEIVALREELAELTPRWQQAQARAAQTPRDEGRIPLAGLEAYSFPWEMADEAARVLNREKNLSSGDVTAALRAVNSIARGVQATGEMSYLGIQMASSMFTAPRSWRRAAGAATRAWLNSGDQVMGNYVRRFDEKALAAGLPSSERWAAAGLRMAESGTEFRVGGRQVPRVVEAVTSVPVVRQARGVAGSLVERADRGFGVAGDTMRLELANTLAHESVLRNRALSDAEMRTIAESANRVTGWTPQRAAGDLGEAVNFAPRYLAARVRSLAQLGSTDVRQRQLARRLIGRYVAIGSTLTILANEMRGEETDFLPFSSAKGGPTWNPLEAEYKNPNFMRVRNVLGRDWSLLGPMDSLMGILASAGSLATNPSGDPSEWMDRLGTIVSGPLASWGADWLIDKETFEGEALNNGPALARDLAQRIVPFAAPELAESWTQAASMGRAGQYGDAAREAGGGLVQGFFGARGTELTEREQQDVFLREQGIDPEAISGRERTAALAGTEEGRSMLDDRDQETLRRAEQGDRVAQALSVSIRTRDRLGELAASNPTEEQYRSQRKEIMGESRGALDEYQDVFEGFRESDNPDEQNAARWYDIFEDAKGPGGLADYDLFDELESEFIATLTDAEWERVQEITGLIDPRLPEMEQRYRQARQQIEDAGFFALRDEAWSTMEEQEFFAATIEGFDNYYDFRDSTIRDLEAQFKDAGWPPGVARAEAEYAVQSHPVIDAHSELMSALRERWILANTMNGAADIATLWGYLTPTKDMRQAIAEGMQLAEAE
jgi:hypothetical protein